jgi:hypothetical protein
MIKAITILALLVSSLIYSQESKEKFIIGVKAQTGKIGLFGLEGEYVFKRKKIFFSSVLLNVNANAMKLETDYGSTIGSGFELGVGSRIYKDNNNKGFFVDNYLNFGSIKFDDKINYYNSSFKIDSNYRYVSILNTSVGYVFFVKKVVIEPFLSVRYNAEIKSNTIDINKDIDNFIFGSGLKIGYSF